MGCTFSKAAVIDKDDNSGEVDRFEDEQVESSRVRKLSLEIPSDSIADEDIAEDHPGMPKRSLMQSKSSRQYSYYSIYRDTNSSSKKAYGIGAREINESEISEIMQLCRSSSAQDFDSLAKLSLIFENETSFPARLVCVLRNDMGDEQRPEFMVFPQKPLVVTLPISFMAEFFYALGADSVKEQFRKFGNNEYLECKMGRKSIISVSQSAGQDGGAAFVVYRKMGAQVAVWKSKRDPSAAAL
eukprot:ANDGO_05570.mRNA.1 hypothetical protein